MASSRDCLKSPAVTAPSGEVARLDPGWWNPGAAGGTKVAGFLAMRPEREAGMDSLKPAAIVDAMIQSGALKAKLGPANLLIRGALSGARAFLRLRRRRADGA
jgi:hypothetical protein